MIPRHSRFNSDVRGRRADLHQPWLGRATLNIYTDVGLVTLMGLISKHGILIVEVANEAQIAGMSKLDAIVHAAQLRLRPILMTTARWCWAWCR